LEDLEHLNSAFGGRYLVERELGVGGMATVYLARDIKHDRPVAIKVLRADLSHSLGPERFLREIHIIARLQHPHILGLIDSGEAEGMLYYVMPYVQGESLRTRLAREASCRLPKPSGSCARSPMRSPTRTRSRSFIATSSRRT
jgi:serine/threonine-protein kinase